MKSTGNNEIKSTAHSKYRCQYHIVFAPKYRRKVIYGQIKKDVGEIIRKLCEQKGVHSKVEKAGKAGNRLRNSVFNLKEIHKESH